MSRGDETARRRRVLRLAAIMPVAEAERVAGLDPGDPDDRREVARVNARLRAGDLGIRSGGTLTGAEALRQLRDRDPAAPGWRIAYLDNMDELDRRSMDVELMDSYEAALGVRAPRHERGWPL